MYKKGPAGEIITSSAPVMLSDPLAPTEDANTRTRRHTDQQTAHVFYSPG